MNGLSYSRLMHGLKLAGIEVNRKMLADLASKRCSSVHTTCEHRKRKFKQVIKEMTILP